MKKARLLIVDDEESVLVGMKRFFRACGYDVDCASEREEAEALLTAGSFSCVIADLCLTDGRGADGLEVVAHVSAQHPGTPVVVLTAYGSPAAEAEARRLGAVAFLPKPQRLERLAKLVDEALAAKS